MDKSCHSSGEPLSPPPPTVPAPPATAATTISGKDPNYLKQLHKSSHKISKPPIRKPSSFDYLNHHPPLSLPLPPPPPQPQPQPPVVFDDEPPSQPPSNQPPVYNINKSDFRDVVQKLTGSTAHSRAPAPQPPMLHHHSSSKPQSSRLQRIRPPPLENLTNRPSSNPCFPAAATSVSVNFFGGQRPPLSPLPPFPTVHAAAESPVSAYMRYLKAADSAQPNNNNNQTSTSALPPLSFPMLLPSSPPPPCGFLPSPKSPYPTNQFGFQPFPLSPTLPLPSPRWEKGL